MPDISLKFRAEELGKSLDNLADELEAELTNAVQDLAESAYSSIIADAQSKLKNTRQDYLSGLSFEKLDETSWLISLDGSWANMIEDGFGPYDMKEVLLNSKKTVQVGSRAGEPWVRTGADGAKYAAVPFEEKQANMSPSMLTSMKGMTATNAKGRQQKITKIFKDLSGNPMTGKVAVASSKNPMLDSMVKYQHINEKGSVSSVYMNYRIISENSSGWNHPGYSGLHAFQAAQQWIEQEMDNIIKTLL